MKSINLFGLILDNALLKSKYYKLVVSSDIVIYAFEGFEWHWIDVYIKFSSYGYISHRIYTSKDTMLNAQDTFDKDCEIILKSLLKLCKRNELVSLQEKLSKYEILL